MQPGSAAHELEAKPYDAPLKSNPASQGSFIPPASVATIPSEDGGSVCPAPVKYATIIPPRCAGFCGVFTLTAPVTESTFRTAAGPRPLLSNVNSPGALGAT